MGGRKHTPEARAKMSAFHRQRKGRPCNQVTRQKNIACITGASCERTDTGEAVGEGVGSTA